MKHIDIQDIESNYELKFNGNVQDLVLMRKNLHISQMEMSRIICKSLKTIQNFESYRCKDYFLIFAYKEILKKKESCF